MAKETKRIQISVSLPVTLDLFVDVADDLDPDGTPEVWITNVTSARIDKPSIRTVNEALTDEDWEQIYKQLQPKT